MRQKGESQNGGNTKIMLAKFSDKRTFVRIRGQEMSIFRNIWRALFFCYLGFEIRPFVLLLMYRLPGFEDIEMCKRVRLEG